MELQLRLAPHWRARDCMFVPERRSLPLLLYGVVRCGRVRIHQGAECSRCIVMVCLFDTSLFLPSACIGKALFLFDPVVNRDSVRLPSWLLAFPSCHGLAPSAYSGPLSTRIHQAFRHHVMSLFDTSFSSCIEFVFFTSTHSSCVVISPFPCCTLET